MTVANWWFVSSNRNESQLANDKSLLLAIIVSVVLLTIIHNTGNYWLLQLLLLILTISRAVPFYFSNAESLVIDANIDFQQEEKWRPYADMNRHRGVISMRHKRSDTILILTFGCGQSPVPLFSSFQNMRTFIITYGKGRGRMTGQEYVSNNDGEIAGMSHRRRVHFFRNYPKHLTMFNSTRICGSC